MIIIRYFHGPDKKLQDKTGYKHGIIFLSNYKLTQIIDRILDSGLNIMIIQKEISKDYIIWIDNKNFK